MKRSFLLAVALASALPAFFMVVPPTAAEARSGCGRDYYRNHYRRCVHQPVRAARAPTGASARCRDGTYSFSQSRRGTCSWHGGVAVWLY
jgi:hypothetical protein